MKAKVLTFGLGCVLLASSLVAQPSLKVYISADMEGVAGVVTNEQLGPSGFEYQRFREFMTNEVLAAIEGARAAGATEFLVSDSHGNGQNLLIEKFPEDVQIVRSWPRHLSMMAGIDESFDAALFIGYHSSTSNTEGVRAHTMSSARLTDVRLNGVSVPEAGINAAIAGHFGVPCVMISGDDAIIAEAANLLGDIAGATVKWAYSFHSARTLTPDASYRLIHRTAEGALRRIGEFKPFLLEAPITAEVRFKNYRPPQLLAYLPIIDRIDSHSVRFTGQTMIEISDILNVITGYNPDLSP
jgi:D-amino peptidase